MAKLKIINLIKKFLNFRLYNKEKKKKSNNNNRKDVQLVVYKIVLEL